MIGMREGRDDLFGLIYKQNSIREGREVIIIICKQNICLGN